MRRQQTLRASVDWSHELLTRPERLLFRRLAAFAGGFDLQAAQAVGTGDGLERHQVLDQLALLVDKSLVTAQDAQEATRYRLLDTIRQYAAEKLGESGEADQVRSRHCGHYAAMARRIDSPADGDPRRLIALLGTEIDNLRAAFGWSLELSDRETALRLASSLQPLWLGQCRMFEGLAWFDAALEQAEEAVALARQLGDPALLGRALLGAGLAADFFDAGRGYFAEAVVVARQAADDQTLAKILAHQAFGAVVVGDPAAARSAAEEGLVLAERAGNDHFSRSCRAWLGWALIWQGYLRRAKAMLSGLVDEAEAARHPLWQAFGLAYLGQALALTGQPTQARAAGKASIAIAGDLGVASLSQVGYICLSVAAIAAGDGDALREASQEDWQRLNFAPEGGPGHHAYMAEADLASADLPAARQHADGNRGRDQAGHETQPDVRAPGQRTRRGRRRRYRAGQRRRARGARHGARRRVPDRDR